MTQYYLGSWEQYSKLTSFTAYVHGIQAKKTRPSMTTYGHGNGTQSCLFNSIRSWNLNDENKTQYDNFGSWERYQSCLFNSKRSGNIGDENKTQYDNFGSWERYLKFTYLTAYVHGTQVMKTRPSIQLWVMGTVLKVDLFNSISSWPINDENKTQYDNNILCLVNNLLKYNT